MSLAMIHRLVLSSCRSKINIDAYWKIVPSLRTLQKKSAMVQTEFPTYVMCIIHKRLFHNSAILQLQKNKLKENGTDVVENISTLQIKKRPTRRNKVVISDDKVPKPDTWNVKALATAEEYNLEALAYGLLDQQLYIPSKISTSTNYVSKNELEDVIEKAKDWALMNGMCLRSKMNFNRDVLQFAPFALFPSPFPREEFQNACDIQITLNTLIHRVAHDYDFLKETLEETIKVDDFTRNLFDIYEIIREEGAAQKVSLGILRSDLMLDTSCPKKDTKKLKPHCCWKQVEINTIASGFGWLGPVSTQLHKFVLQELGYTAELNNLPENNALQTLCSGMIEAWNLYGNPQAVILFVIEDVTYNICDQRFHEFEIRKQNPNVKVIRRNLTQLAATAKLGINMELIVNNYTVSVVYYRCGYEPGQYHTKKEWNARLLIERSLAIKCPSIQYHLAGTKKVQQTLAKPGMVARFLKDENMVTKVKEIFTGLYPLDFDEHGNVAVEMGISDPQRFVLKPQREGGCNNLYGTDIKDFLESVKSEQARVAWILMDRIYPPVHKNYVVKPGTNVDLDTKEFVSELGIFGVIIGDDKNIIVNKQGGHMLRTKLAIDNEGGVATGLGACDSPFLID